MGTSTAVMETILLVWRDSNWLILSTVECVQCHHFATKLMVGLFDWLVGIFSCATPIYYFHRKQKVNILKWKMKL